MTSSWRRIAIGGAFFAVTCVVAVTGYMIAGWQLLDAIYMVVITVFGVGYGEAKPLESPFLKVFTMGVIIAGCSSAIYVVGGFVQMVAEGEINRMIGTRRMSKGIERLKDHVLICGFGRVGQMLAHDLAAAGMSLVVIDSSESRIQEAQRAGFLAVLGSAAEEPTLEAAGIRQARVLATVLPDDAANVFITLVARELNSSIEIIARAEAPSTEKKLLRSGANRIVMPALIGATKIAHMIVRPSAEDLLSQITGTTHLSDELEKIGLHLFEVEVQDNSPLVGQTVADVEIGGGGFVVVAIKRADGAIVQNSDATLTLSTGDRFMIVGHKGALPQLSQRARSRAQLQYRGTKS